MKMRRMLLCSPFLALLASSFLFAGEFRYQTTRRIIDQAAAMDAAAARTKVLQAPLETRDDELFLWRWIDLDPQSAVTSLLAATRHEDAAKAMAAWAVEDPLSAAEVLSKSKSLGERRVCGGSWPFWVYSPTTEEFVIPSLIRRKPIEAKRLQTTFSEEGADLIADSFFSIAATKDPISTLKRAIHEKDLLALPYDLNHTLALKWGSTDFDGMVRFLKTADIEDHQRDYLLRDGIQGLAEQSIDQATAKARQYSMNDADCFLVRARVALDDALRWFAKQDLKGDDRKYTWYSLNGEFAQETIPADQAFRALKKHGLWEPAKEDLDVEWMEQRASMPVVDLPEYPEPSGMFDRAVILARFLDELPEDAFPSLWAKAFHQEQGDLLWQEFEHRLILNAWTSKDPRSAWIRRNCGGHHFYANSTYLIQCENVLVDWFRARPEEVLPLWQQREISAPHHYDEAGRYGWINLTARFADEMSKAGDWQKTWRWFLNAMRRGGATAFQGQQNNLVSWQPPNDLLKTAAKHPDEALAIYCQCLPTPKSYPELDQELRMEMERAGIIAGKPTKTD